MPITAAQLNALSESFDFEKWNGKVRAALEPHYTAIALDQAEREAEQYDLDFDADDPFVDKFFTGYVGDRITQIDETTRDKLTSVLQDSLSAGHADSLQELAGRLRDAVGDAYAFSPARALTIARTETANGYNAGAVLTYIQNGIEHVEVSDGDGDDECEEADGEIWTVDEALANPTAHPNCVRSFAPVVDDIGDE